MSNPIIEVRNLSKKYKLGSIGATSLREEAERFFRRFLPSSSGPPPEQAGNDFWALQDVSFEVQAGEVLGIIGRNGAGKSTLLKILSRITEPSSGSAVLKGRVASLLEVGTGFHPELSGRENIYLNGSILGMKKREMDAKLDEIIAFSEIDQFIDTPVKRYSSGMYVRLAFAVAAHLDPEILIIDEVLAVGDYAFQKKCLGKMQDISTQQNKTVLFVSHNMSAITKLCSHCLYLANGKVKGYGETAELSSAYLEDGLPRGTLERPLHEIPRTGNAGQKIRMSHIKMEAEGGKVYFKDPITVVLEACTRSRLENVFFGLTIMTSDFVPLLSVEQLDEPFPLVENGQSVSARMTIPEPGLPPGRYIILAGAGAGSEFGLDFVNEALIFDVHSKSEDLVYAERPGLGIRPRCQWVKIPPVS